MGLTNSQYDTLMREYDMRRQSNQAISDMRHDEVYAAIPQLSDIDDQIQSAAMDSFGQRLSGHSDDGQLHETIERLKKEKQRLITKAGFSPDYLKPVYTCRDCHDTGFIDGEKCHCFKQAAINLLYGDSHLGDVLERENFSTFSLDYYSRQPKAGGGMSPYEAALAALEAAHKVCEVPGGNLLLFGDPGLGKTFLSHCIAAEFLSSGRSVIYVTAYDLIDIFSKEAFERSPEAKKDYADIFSCSLLIIDDLGTEYTNSFTQPAFFSCINDRLLKKRSTVISTNLSLQGIKETYTERIFSRLAESYTFAHLLGEDIRMKKKMTG